MRISRYVNSLPFEGGVLLHSALYNTAIKVYSTECISEFEKLKSVNSFQLLKDNKFLSDLEKTHIIVSDNTEESAIVNYLYSQRDDYLNLFLIVTRQCNFRCPYCYQDHTGHIMQWETYETAENIFIESCKNKPQLQKKPVINFFGGEPLLESKNIIRFMTELKHKCERSQIEFKDVMGHVTSNGYLLTPANFEQLINNQVTNYQITLDGFAETHNKSRYLIGKRGSWETIVKNLINIKNTGHNCHVQIRTNFTNDIVDNFSDFLTFLDNNFGDDNRFSFYFEAAKDYGTVGTEDGLTIVGDDTISLKRILEIAEHNGISGEKLEFRHLAIPFGGMCYASNPHEVVIDYDGTLRKCTFELDDANNQLTLSTLEGQAVWTSYDNCDTCKECSIYPICYGKKCPNSYFPRHKPSEESCRSIHAAYEAGLVTTYLF